jgi:hypothetical protein
MLATPAAKRGYDPARARAPLVRRSGGSMRYFSLVCLSGLLAAQTPQTFVVDWLNGPGAHFTEINAALAAVPDGSILNVRSGQYQAVVVDGKAVTILCELAVYSGVGTAFENYLTIRNTQAHQVVTVRGLLRGALFGLVVRDTAGPVNIDGVGAAISIDTFFGPAAHIQRADQVVVRGFTMYADWGCYVDDSNAVFEDCQLRGADGWFMNKSSTHGPGPGLMARNSTVQFVHSTAVGGHGAQFTWGGYTTIRPGAAAIQCEVVALRVAGLATHALVGGNTPGGAPQSAILGTGTARVEPQIPMTGNPPAGPGITLTRPVMPSLVTQDAAPGGTLVAHRYGAVGSTFVVALGLPGPAATLPGITDPLWFDALRYGIEAVGVGTALPLVVQRPVPNQAGLIGVNLVWQAADLHATGIIELSNPSPTVIR